MSSKLENKLLQYEKSAPISNDSELIKAIEYIISNEESLPFEERDYDLIEEAVDAVLSLRGVDVGQLEEHAEHVTDKCFDKIQTHMIKTVKKSKAKSVKLKLLIPAAAALLVLAATFTSYALGVDLLSMTKEAYNKLVDKVFYKNESTDLIKTENFKEYDSLQSFMESETFSGLLLPCDYKGDCTITFENYGSFVNITLYMEHDNTKDCIRIKSPDTIDFGGKETVLIKNYEIYFSSYDDIYQGEFSYKGNSYVITASSYDNLITVIENLEEK